LLPSQTCNIIAILLQLSPQCVETACNIIAIILQLSA